MDPGLPSKHPVHGAGLSCGPPTASVRALGFLVERPTSHDPEATPERPHHHDKRRRQEDRPRHAPHLVPCPTNGPVPSAKPAWPRPRHDGDPDAPPCHHRRRPPRPSPAPGSQARHQDDGAPRRPCQVSPIPRPLAVAQAGHGLPSAFVSIAFNPAPPRTPAGRARADDSARGRGCPPPTDPSPCSRSSGTHPPACTRWARPAR